tara:strand:+ start:585 stop:833 length:249 start_codon:yes stop_codon:yes gene_type:complete
MNNMPTYNKDKPLEIYVEQLSFTISSLSEEIIKANDKILKLHEMMDNCIAYVLKNKNDRYITDAEKRMEYKEHEEFIAGGTD